MKSLVMLAATFLLFSTMVRAESETNSDLFQRLVELASKNAASERQGAQGDAIRFLAHLVPNDLAQPRTADYFTVRGLKDDQEFTPVEVNVISEVFTLDANKNWVITQWIYVLSGNGSIREYSHKKMTRNSENIITDISFLEETPESAVEVLKGKLEGWFTRLPYIEIATIGCSVPSPQCLDI